MRAVPAPRVPMVAASVLLAMAAMATAGVQDDAFFTLRVADLAAQGFGPVFNVGERVLAVTHPLWLTLVVPVWALTERAWLALGIPAVLSVVAMLVGLRRLGGHAPAAVVMLACTQAVHAWLLSGLENPLTFAAVVVFVVVLAEADARPASTRRLVVAASVLALCRHDALLLAAPAVGMRLWRCHDRSHLHAAAVGTWPLVAWLVAAAIYYGSPIPNTALAKLPPNVTIDRRVGFGLTTLLATARFDPAAVLVSAAAGVGLWRSGAWQARAMLVGSLLSMVWVVAVGGDYLLGRFVGPAVVALVAAWAAWGAPVRGWVLALLVAAGGTSMALRVGAPRWHHLQIDVTAAAERTWQRTAELGRPPRWTGRVRVEPGRPGRLGFEAGADVYAMTPWGLADPLVARLPVRGWYPGHGTRVLPPGYVAWLRGDAAPGLPPDVARLLDALAVVHRGPVWSAERARTAWTLGVQGASPWADLARSQDGSPASTRNP